MAGEQKKVHLNQESWTNEKTDRVSVYMKSKTLAEKAAWDFYNDQNNVNKMELTVINPGPIYGPTLTGNLTGASMSLVRDIISGKMPMLPNTSYIMSDVRDVAKIHVEALENAKSDGGRFIVASEKPHSFIEIASILKNNGYHKASPKKAPSVLIKIISLFSKEMKGMLPFLDTEVSADIAVTKDVFDWCPIPFDKTVIETAQSIKTF
jgi:dihydroflavonol-4-reductase